MSSYHELRLYAISKRKENRYQIHFKIFCYITVQKKLTCTEQTQ